jgi:hypothetical protein
MICGIYNLKYNKTHKTQQSNTYCKSSKRKTEKNLYYIYILYCYEPKSRSRSLHVHKTILVCFFNLNYKQNNGECWPILVISNSYQSLLSHTCIMSCVYQKWLPWLCLWITYSIILNRYVPT